MMSHERILKATISTFRRNRWEILPNDILDELIAWAIEDNDPQALRYLSGAYRHLEAENN